MLTKFGAQVPLLCTHLQLVVIGTNFHWVLITSRDNKPPFRHLWLQQLKETWKKHSLTKSLRTLINDLKMKIINNFYVKKVFFLYVLLNMDLDPLILSFSPSLLLLYFVSFFFDILSLLILFFSLLIFSLKFRMRKTQNREWDDPTSLNT